jgi:hypothetical protein
MNLGQGAVAPLQKEHTDLSNYTKEADSKLKEEGVTQEQLDMVDSGDLAAANKEKKGMETTAKTEPLAVQKFAQQETDKVDKDLKQEEKKERDGLRAKRRAGLGATAQKQKGAKSALEKKREEVANKINGIYKDAQDKVKKKLADLETQSMKRFEEGNAKATKEFEDNVNRELDAFKEDRYSGWFGWARKAKDWLLGMDDLPEVKAIFDRNRATFVSTINKLVEDITADNKRVIQECKDELANAKKAIKKYVDELDPGLKDIGKKAAEEMNAKLAELDQFINQKEQELQQKLADKQQAAIKAIDEKIEKMKEAMSGALSKLGKLLLAAKKFFTWALQKFGYSLEEIEGIINKGAAVLKAIFTKPIQFVKNLVKAASTGFENFGKKFLTHLKDAIFDWLTGSLEGIQLPSSWDLKGIASVALQMLGLTWSNIRGKLVRLVGENAVKAMETTFDLVVTLVKEGPMAAWEKIKEMADDIKEAFIEGVKDFIKIKIVEKAIETILSLLIPGAGIIRAIVGIYDTIVFFIQKAKQIAQMVGNFLSSIGEIAMGNIGAAAAALEKGLATALKLVINFLAKFLRLDGITAKIRNAIQKLRAKVDSMLDKMVEWIAEKARRLGRFVAQAGVPQDPQKRLDEGVKAGVTVVNKLPGQRVTAAVIPPLLSIIKTRYQLQSLEAILQNGKWAVKGVVNPVKIELTDKEKQEQEQQKNEFVETFKPAFGGDEGQSKAFLTELSSSYDHAAVVSLQAAVKGGQSPALIVSLIRAEKPAFKIEKVVVPGQIELHYKGVAIVGGKLVTDFDSKTLSVDAPGIAEVRKKSLELDFLVPPQVKAMEVKGVGKEMFNLAFEHFKNDIDSIGAFWMVSADSYPPDGLSDNLKLFILNYSGDRVAAAKATWTAAMAEKKNYDILDPNDVKVNSGLGRGMCYDSVKKKFVRATRSEFGIDSVKATFRKKP